MSKPSRSLPAQIMKYTVVIERTSNNYAAYVPDLPGCVATGAVFDSLKCAGTLEFRLPIPPLYEQLSISQILGTLDDKIEVNRKVSATVDAIARTLFKSWFIDFDPVRTKGYGRDLCLAQKFLALFPESFDNEGRPQGWSAKPLDQVAEFLNGLAMQKFPPFEVSDSLPVIKISELRSGITPRTGRASRNIPSDYVVRDGDFLFSWSGSLLAKFWTGGEGALNQHLFKVTSSRYPMWFCSQWVYHHLEEFQAIAASKATTMGHIPTGASEAGDGHLPARRCARGVGPHYGALSRQSNQERAGVSDAGGVSRPASLETHYR